MHICRPLVASGKQQAGSSNRGYFPPGLGTAKNPFKQVGLAAVCLPDLPQAGKATTWPLALIVCLKEPNPQYFWGCRRIGRRRSTRTSASRRTMWTSPFTAATGQRAIPCAALSNSSTQSALLGSIGQRDQHELYECPGIAAGGQTPPRCPASGLPWRSTMLRWMALHAGRLSMLT